MTGVLSQRMRPVLRQPWVLTLVLSLGILVLLEAVNIFGLIPPVLLRPPSEVVPYLYEGLQTPEFQQNLWISVTRILIAFTLSFVIGMAVSLLLWKYRLLRRTYLPLIGTLFGTPLVLLYLVFVVIFGRGTGAIVAIAVPIGAAPIVLNATDSLSSVDPGLVDVSRSFNATQFQTLRKVIIPATAPEIFSGVRLGFSYVMTVVIGVEFLLVTEGLGGMISEAHAFFNTTKMFSGIALIVLLVMTTMFVLKRIENLIQQ